MHAECVKCCLSWNVSIFQKIPKSGYICPRCRKSEIRQSECFQKKAAVTIARLILSGALTAPFAAWSIIYAFLERGYRAYGGEYLFIIMVFLAVYWALGKFMDDGNMDIF